MHLNLPMHHETGARYVWRYCKSAFIGMLGPELVVWPAWRQHISARALSNEIQDMKSAITKRRPSGSSCVSSDKWTMNHGFFAGMGGFVIELDGDDDGQASKFVPRYKRLTLTPRGIRLLAECGLLPDIDEEEILDRSKTDGMGKALACLQGAWMLLQVIQRRIVHLPITLLEVNTLGHVFCAFLIYILWWNKPRWIKHPTILHGGWIQPIAAFMYMTSHISGHQEERKWLLRDFGVDSEMSQPVFLPPVQDDVKIEKCGQISLPSMIEVNAMSRELGYSPQKCYTAPGSHAHSMTHEIKHSHFVRLSELESHDDGPLRTLSTMTIQEDESTRLARWRLAVEAIDTYPAIRKRMLPH